jgi:hypothetical protein
MVCSAVVIVGTSLSGLHGLALHGQTWKDDDSSMLDILP